jgi:hypothetical protein
MLEHMLPKGPRLELRGNTSGVQEFGAPEDMHAEKKRDVQRRSTERQILL